MNQNNTSSRPKVAVWATENDLSSTTVGKFLSSDCNVYIFSGQLTAWEKIVIDFGQSSRVKIIKNTEKNILEKHVNENNLTNNFDYTLFISSAFSREYQTNSLQNDIYELEKIFSNIFLRQAKVLLVFPEKQIDNIQINKLIDNSKFTLLRTVYIKETSNTLLQDVDVNDLTNRIIKEVFVFGLPGEKVVIAVKQAKTSVVRSVTQRPTAHSNNVKIISDDDIARRLENLGIKYRPKRKNVSWRISKRDVKRLSVFIKPILFFLSLVILPIIIWTILTIASGLFLYLSVGDIERGNLANASNKAQVSIAMAKLPKDFATQLNIKSAAEINLLIMNAAEVVNRSTLLGEYGLKLADEIGGRGNTNLTQYASKINIEIGDIHNRIGLLQGEIVNQSGFNRYIVNTVLNRIGVGRCDKISCTFFNRSLKQLEEVNRLSLLLPDILGDKKPRTYLILFQNNMELRPTGGFIGSFAIVKFDGGKIVDLNVLDVYSADGQLKGHIEPPSPIKNYLGEANWYMRDSNWDPDFVKSASKAEWFLDKEMDVKVDGVFGVDIEVAKKLLKVIGPVKLEDFNTTVDEKNLYEVTQREVEDNFFPGSRKKANFLTSLSKKIIMKITQEKLDNPIGLITALYSSLESRHLQIFLHNTKEQMVVSSLGWDGRITEPSCLGECTSDWLGVVEANLGVNKVNYFIERRFFLNANYDNQRIYSQLLIELKNTGKVNYKNYLRLILPNKAEVVQVTAVAGGGRETFTPDLNYIEGRLESGMLINIGAGETKTITIAWQQEKNINFDRPGSLVFHWRKQAGTNSDKVSARFNFQRPVGVTPFGGSHDLTAKASLEYNTVRANQNFSSFLDRDINLRFNW